MGSDWDRFFVYFRLGFDWEAIGKRLGLIFVYFRLDLIGKQLGLIFRVFSSGISISHVFRLGFDWEAIGKQLGSIFHVFSPGI